MQDICKARYIAFGSAGHASAISPISCETMAERYQRGELRALVK
jgi:fructose-bisphosphate aldolase class II